MKSYIVVVIDEHLPHSSMLEALELAISHVANLAAYGVTTQRFEDEDESLNELIEFVRGK